MSHYTKIKTKIKDAEVLKKTIKEMGYPFEEGRNIHLYGYLGDRRPQTADIVIRRKYIGASSNDIGFKKVGNYYDLIISEYDEGIHGQKFDELQKKALNIQQEIERQVRQKYALEKTIKEVQKIGFNIISQAQERDKTIKLVVRRFR